ncbi:hypothetical protein NY08_3366 [Rhodococcus sp. B7740]|nr:hypothetical protein NY08_3366 [Rhodococcus sp. B7740]
MGRAESPDVSGIGLDLRPRQAKMTKDPCTTSVAGPTIGT